MKISYIYNRNFRNDARSIFREREREREREKKNGVGATILGTFLVNIFFLVFYVNIQPSFSETRIECFNMKIRLLFRET